MNARVDLMKVGAGALEILVGLENLLKKSTLDEQLRHLVKLRSSQINGCLYCCDMHTREARLSGVPERKIAQLPAFDESSLYDEREKAALAWAESLVHIDQTHAPDAAWERVRRFFDEQQAADLTLLCATINLWNRLAIGTRAQPPATWPKLPVTPS